MKAAHAHFVRILTSHPSDSYSRGMMGYYLYKFGSEDHFQGQSIGLSFAIKL